MAFWKKDAENKTESKPAHATVGRNDPCHCGSKKKYKKCCLTKDEAAEHKVLEENWKKAEAEAEKEVEKQSKEAKETSGGAPVKHGPSSQTTKQQHPTFVPHQVNLPRKSGGG